MLEQLRVELVDGAALDASAAISGTSSASPVRMTPPGRRGPWGAADSAPAARGRESAASGRMRDRHLRDGAVRLHECTVHQSLTLPTAMRATWASVAR